METKALIRQRILAVRDGMPAGERMEKSRRIAGRVMGHPVYQKASGLLCYVSYRSEVDTLFLMERALGTGKEVYCPKVRGKEMDFYRIRSLDDLKEGYKGIREPQALDGEALFQAAGAWQKDGLSESRFRERPFLMIMPGSVFDREGNRIGYGGGYYDRYLERCMGLMLMALCFEAQVQEKIPSDAHDRKTNLIVTEDRVYTCW